MKIKFSNNTERPRSILLGTEKEKFMVGPGEVVLVGVESARSTGGDLEISETEEGLSIWPANADDGVQLSVKMVEQLSAEEQMARFEEGLKDDDWGHQPC